MTGIVTYQRPSPPNKHPFAAVSSAASIPSPARNSLSARLPGTCPWLGDLDGFSQPLAGHPDLVNKLVKRIKGSMRQIKRFYTFTLTRLLTDYFFGNAETTDVETIGLGSFFGKTISVSSFAEK